MESIEYINSLKTLIEQYNYEYYVLGKPSVTDQEYDSLFNELLKLSPESIEIGSDIFTTTPFKEYPHVIPMLSLDKIYNWAALQKWLEKFPAQQFSLEPKIDGVSISLIYNKGILVQALTRGNGRSGLDITQNIKTIKTIPEKISLQEQLVVRGEVYLAKEDFKKYQQQEQTVYANPRNLTAGILRRIQVEEVEKVPLSIFLYQANKIPDDFSSHQESLKFLQKENFPLTPYISITSDYTEIKDYIKNISLQRDSLPFEIDGLVLKINNRELQNQLGYTNHHPKWAMAFKLDSPTNTTRVENIQIQVGRTGKITPVAILSPVKINGSIVQKATLHNQEYINALEIGIGDIVNVSKRGEIIPAVEKVLEKNSQTYVIPIHCPSCNSLLQKEGAHLFCTNIKCPERQKMTLLFFTQKLGLEGFGTAVLDLLYTHFNIIYSYDLWNIPWEQLYSIEGFGDKKIKNLQEQLELVKNTTNLQNLLVALGIPEISDNVVKLLFQEGFDSVEKWKNLYTQDLTHIKGIGIKTNQKIKEYFQPSSIFIEMLEKFILLGFNLTYNNENNIKKIGSLQNTYWVLTGTFEHYKPREKAKELINQLGGVVESNITNQTTHLLYGKLAGSKLQKAQNKDSITLISEQEFVHRYNSQNDPSIFTDFTDHLF